jgi:hypothetical protein
LAIALVIWIGAVGRLTMAALIFLGMLAAMRPRAGLFGALDMALFAGLWSALPLAIEGFMGEAIAAGTLWIVLQWRPNLGMLPSPFERSLRLLHFFRVGNGERHDRADGSQRR